MRTAKDMFSLNNRRALVTGSTQGIGYAVASLFSERGAFVTVHCSKDAEKARRIAGEIASKTGGKTAGIACDLGDEDAAERIFDMTGGAALWDKVTETYFRNSGRYTLVGGEETGPLVQGTMIIVK